MWGCWLFFLDLAWWQEVFVSLKTVFLEFNPFLTTNSLLKIVEASSGHCKGQNCPKTCLQFEPFAALKSIWKILASNVQASSESKISRKSNTVVSTFTFTEHIAIHHITCIYSHALQFGQVVLRNKIYAIVQSKCKDGVSYVKLNNSVLQRRE